MGFDSAARTHVGLRRSLNEDAVLASAERGLWAVADGMGGHEAGEVASAMVIEALSACETHGDAGTLAAAAMTALGSVNDQLQAMGRASAEERTIGSTVVGLVADDHTYTCFWAGDSRAYVRRDGMVLQLTRDHSLVQELVDAGMLNADEADSHPNANIITRAVGAEVILRLDTARGDLQSGDLFLLASDGLTRLVDHGELFDSLAGADLEATADGLIAMALDRGGPDNISVVLVRVQ